MLRSRNTLALMTALAGSLGAALALRILARDSTLALLWEGYRFIPERCRRYRSDVFETRLMLTKVICMVGEEAAKIFTILIGLPERGPCLKLR